MWDAPRSSRQSRCIALADWLRDQEQQQDLPDNPLAPEPVLGVGDELVIEIVGLKDTKELCQIHLDGMLYYGPTMHRCGGKTMHEIRRELFTELLPWYRNPHLVINRGEQVSDCHHTGRVNKPELLPVWQ